MVTKVKNPSIDLSGDTSGIVMPSGTTAQKPSATEGLLRYNSELKRLEQSDGSDFETIALPPTVSSISGNFNEDNDTTITINGTNFMTGATVTFLNNADDSSLGNSPTVSRVSSTQLTAVTGFASSPIATSISAIKVKVINPTGQNAESTTTISRIGDPTFRNDAGSLGTIFDSGRAAGGVYDAGADSNDSVAIYHNITSGSIPAGMSFNNDNGDISGTPDAVGSDTTSNFTVTAIVQSADSAIRTEARAFSLTIKAPNVSSYTSAGAFTFTAPFSGNYEVLVVGGGGGGGSGGNGSEPHGCPGNCNGGVGVEISEFSTFGESGFFGGGGNGSQQKYDPVNPSGGAGTDGNGNGANGTGGGSSGSAYTGGVYIRY